MADQTMEAMLFNDDDSDSDDSNSGGGGGDQEVKVQPGGSAYPPPAAALAANAQSQPVRQPLRSSFSPLRAPGPAAPSPSVVPRPRSPIVRSSAATASNNNVAPPPSSYSQPHSNVSADMTATSATGSVYPSGRNVPRSAPTASSGMPTTGGSSIQSKVSTMSQQDQQAKLKSLYQQSASSALHASSGSSINRPIMPATSGPISEAQPSRTISVNIEPTPLRDMQSQSHSAQSQRHLQSTTSMAGQSLQQQQQQPTHAMMGVGPMKTNQTPRSGVPVGGQINRNVASSGGTRILAPSSSSHTAPQHSMHPSAMPSSSSLPPKGTSSAAQPMPAMPTSGTGIFPSRGAPHPSSYASRGTRPPPSSLSAGTSSSVPSTLTPEQKTSKERKEQFLMFTKVLMKYLEQKDPAMHTRAKEVIRDCARKNKEGNPAYSSLSASMQSHLKNLVGDLYWKKAQDYLRQYLATQYLKSGKPLQEARRKAELMARSAASPLAIESGMLGMQPAATSTPMVTNMPSDMITGAGGPMPLPHGRGQGAGRKQTTMPQQAQRRTGASAPSAGSATVKAGAQHLKQQQKEQTASSGAKLGPENMSIDSASSAPFVPSSGAQSVPAPTSSASGSKKKSSAASTSASGKTSSGSTKGGTSGGSVAKSTSSSPTATSKKKKAVPTISKKATTTTVTSSSSVPREYNEALEMLDHVVDYDVRSCALILGKESKRRGDVNITEEQKKLLYHDFGITKIGPRKGLYGGVIPSERASPKSVIDDSTQSTLPIYLKGWGTRNVVSSRIAWAKLRLLEEEEENLGNISLPTLEKREDPSKIVPKIDSASPTKATSSSTLHHWFNDESAEEDEALALISEATQRYIRTLLEGAMTCASRRLNLDGIRLWHQQHAAANLKETDKNITTQGKSQDPPLHLRLGCDTRRQYAQVQGNAAKTYQRFEEALSRHPCNKEMNEETMFNATSMTELSKIPKLPSAANKADYNAKRAFEIYGGKESGEPPLGRVPKKAKILAKDFQLCLQESAFAVKRKRASDLAFY
jgi:Cobalamin biosynthesis protein CobN and related Mg-chelatases